MRKKFELAAAWSTFATCGLAAMPAHAQSAVDVCTGLSVDIPVLNQVTDATSGLLSGLLDPVLNLLIGDVNTNIVDVLSGQNIGLTVLDENGNLVSPSDNCNLTADDLVIDEDAGIAIGGGTVSSLGGTGNPLANAGEINSIAIGNDASTDAAASNAIALGLRGSVDAIDGIAIGRDASTTGEGGVAIGADSSTGGYGAAAYGMTAAAAGDGATAIGYGASAAQDGATAIGAGATTSRAGQMAFGTAGNTYSMSGVTSAASRAAQSGPVELVTADASGNLATVSMEDLLSELVNVYEDVDVTNLRRMINEVQTESRQGIAAAMAMAQAPMPSAPGRTTWAANMAVYKGQWASGFAFAHRLPTNQPININAAISLNASGVPGARAGLAGEF